MAKTETAIPKPAPQNYYIVDTRDQYQLDDTGKLQLMKVVYYKTILGDTGSVSVAKSDFTAELINALIQREVDEIYKLRGSP